jgi:hypothetical protein
VSSQAENVKLAVIAQRLLDASLPVILLGQMSLCPNNESCDIAEPFAIDASLGAPIMSDDEEFARSCFLAAGLADLI